MAELLLDNGSDVEGGKGVGMSPLQLAVLTRNEAGVRLLLHRGADANMRGPNGRTAMHLCACSGDKKVIDYGLEIDPIYFLNGCYRPYFKQFIYVLFFLNVLTL